MKKKFILKKRFGQVFLKDDSIIKDFIKTINLSCRQLAIEIGPGLGILTKELVKYTKKLIAIEIDSDLVIYLKNKFLKSQVEIINQNAMKIDFTRISNRYKQKLRLFGNLPYNVSVPLIFHFFNHINCIYDMHFMLQKEVADRLMATPNSKSYGRLSVISQCYCNIFPIKIVPPKYFFPKPKVNSIIIKLIPNNYTTFSSFNFKILSNITRIAFNKRRKIIRNSLKDIFTIQQLEKNGICSFLRAENLSVKEYCKLTNIFSNSNKIEQFKLKNSN